MLTYTQEWDVTKAWHRVKKMEEKDITYSNWASYTQIAYLDGHVSYTAYYGEKEGICTAENFCKMIAPINEENID